MNGIILILMKKQRPSQNVERSVVLNKLFKNALCNEQNKLIKRKYNKHNFKKILPPDKRSEFSLGCLLDMFLKC